MSNTIKIRMLSRFTGAMGKMEQGLIYEVDSDYADELVKAGIAKIMVDEIIMEKPIHVTAKEIGQARTKSGRFMPKAKVK